MTSEVVKAMDKEVIEFTEIWKALNQVKVANEIIFMTLSALFVQRYGNSVSTSNFIMVPEYATYTTKPPTYYIAYSSALAEGPKYLLDFIGSLTSMEVVQEVSSAKGGSVLRLMKRKGG